MTTRSTSQPLLSQIRIVEVVRIEFSITSEYLHDYITGSHARHGTTLLLQYWVRRDRGIPFRLFSVSNDGTQAEFEQGYLLPTDDALFNPHANSFEADGYTRDWKFFCQPASLPEGFVLRSQSVSQPETAHVALSQADLDQIKREIKEEHPEPEEILEPEPPPAEEATVSEAEQPVAVQSTPKIVKPEKTSETIKANGKPTKPKPKYGFVFQLPPPQ